MSGRAEVCCAIDLSELSLGALREAARVARRDGAGLTIVHVFGPARSSAATDLLVMTPAQLDAQIREELAPVMNAARREAEETAPGLPVDTVLLAGAPADALVDFLRDRGFDLVVVATHGRRGVRRLVLGSVAEHVVRSAPCPVLVYRPNERGAAD
jgi:nucleotide-binding universal stress UspA family protein